MRAVLKLAVGSTSPCLSRGYMVNHGLTVRPQPLHLMAPERRAAALLLRCTSECLINHWLSPCNLAVKAAPAATRPNLYNRTKRAMA